MSDHIHALIDADEPCDTCGENTVQLCSEVTCSYAICRECVRDGERIHEDPRFARADYLYDQHKDEGERR